MYLLEKVHPYHLESLALLELDLHPYDSWSITTIKNLYAHSIKLSRKFERVLWLITKDVDTSSNLKAVVNNREICGYFFGSIVCNEGTVENIAVVPEHRRKGLGRYLMLNFINYSNHKLVDYIHLEVRKSNDKAINLYEELLFRRNGIRAGYYPGNPIDKTKNSEDALLYSLDSLSIIELQFEYSQAKFTDYMALQDNISPEQL